MHPEYLRQFLRALPGQSYCNDCLHHLLGLSPTAIRTGTQRLLGEAGFSLRNSTCRNCHKPAVTVMYQAARHPEDAEESNRVEATLTLDEAPDRKPLDGRVR